MAKNKIKKEDLSKINPYNIQQHGISFSDWIKQVFIIKKDEFGKPLYRTITDRTEDGFKEVKIYKLKRIAELWLICLTALIKLEFAHNYKSYNKKDFQSYKFYGRYSILKNMILSAAPDELKYQLSKSITLQTISTAMKRIENDGFITIDYDHSVKYKEREEGKYFRTIKINHQKLVELSDFNLSKKERSKTWNNYHRCSREHRYIRKRIFSSLQPLINDLADKEKKMEYRKKLASLKLKLKGEYDVFQAFILHKQKLYKTKQINKMTIIKSEKDLSEELLSSMYNSSSGLPPEEYEKAYGIPGANCLTSSQEQALQDFYARIK